MPLGKEKPAGKAGFSYLAVDPGSAGLVGLAGRCRFNQKTHAKCRACNDSNQCEKHNDTRKHSPNPLLRRLGKTAHRPNFLIHGQIK
ncbi:hypothetical protein FIU93_23810 [Labrenzia sp. THAF35]|nr:hypothetical protein FIU93_23810 [Labrenzia sp. THAF35]